MGGTEKDKEQFSLLIVLGIGIAVGLLFGVCFGLVIA